MIPFTTLSWKAKVDLKKLTLYRDWDQHSGRIMPLFGSSKKSPAELVKIANDDLQVIENESTGSRKYDKVSYLLMI